MTSTWMVAIVIAAAVAWFNLLQVTPDRWRGATAPLGAVAAGVLGAVWLFAEVDPTQGLVAAIPWTLGALAATSVVVAVARTWPRWGARLSDRRIRAMRGAEFWLHVLVRIPVTVALVEEIVFRGVIWTLLADIGGPVTAILGSSVAFGCSHAIGARDQARREGHGVAGWVAVTILATTLAGVALGALRWSTGGIWAAVGVHTAVNATLAWGARNVGGHRVG